jgi:hypothetical protein
MTAIKKTTPKSTKSPAPATKPAAVSAPATKSAPAPAKAKAPAKKKAAAATPVPAARATTQAPVAVVPPPAPVASTPTIKVIATKPVATVIIARIDIGFGNLLHVRGEGPGLSWDKGVAMNCLGGDHWELALAESTRPYVFKFLVNDLSWSTGPDYTLVAGQRVTLTPEF